MKTSVTRRTLAGILFLGLVGAACTAGASPSPSAGGSPAGGGTAINVALSEWSVVPTPDSVAAGDVTFKVTNNGPDDIHEFVVIKTDVAFSELPTDDNGAVEEAGGGMEVMGEIEDIAVGSTQELSLNLLAGKYVLICNIYDETENEAHYKQGMRIPFTVS
jgi:uncharacterized cupredoxin-like copper-binding protein